jgi:hypothetical protein
MRQAPDCPYCDWGTSHISQKDVKRTNLNWTDSACPNLATHYFIMEDPNRIVLAARCSDHHPPQSETIRVMASDLARFVTPWRSITYDEYFVLAIFAL